MAQLCFERIYVIADTHFSNQSQDSIATFGDLLTSLETKNSALVLLGDLFFFWTAYDVDLSEAQVLVLSQIKSFKDRGGRVIFLVGNKDLLFSKKDSEQQSTGVIGNFDIIAPDQIIVNVSGKNIYFNHGDIIEKTRGYPYYRALAHSAVLRFILNIFPKKKVQHYVYKMGKLYDSKIKIARRNIPYENWHRWLKQVQSKYEADMIVSGHFHPRQMIIKQLDEGRFGIMLPAWFESLEYLVIDKQGHSLLKCV